MKLLITVLLSLAAIFLITAMQIGNSENKNEIVLIIDGVMFLLGYLCLIFGIGFSFLYRKS